VTVTMMTNVLAVLFVVEIVVAQISTLKWMKIVRNSFQVDKLTVASQGAEPYSMDYRVVLTL